MMSNVAEIASAARAISSRELAQTVQKAQLNAMKLNMDVQAEVQLQMVNLLKDIQTHLGTHVNLTA